MGLSCIGTLWICNDNVYKKGVFNGLLAPVLIYCTLYNYFYFLTRGAI